MSDWTPDEPEQAWLEVDRRPEGLDDATVEAAGKLGEAVEWMERARGALYDFHQRCGRTDLLLGEAADLFESAGRTDIARNLRRHIVGRNVLEGRWSFQIVEEYDATYWSVVRDFHAAVRAELLGGSEHVFESEMKEDRRSPGEPHHQRRPDTRG